MSTVTPTRRTQRVRARRHRAPAILTGVLLAVVCALALFTVVIPAALGAQSYTVLTGSMRPSLEQGHLIAVRPTPIDDVRVGDVVTYQLHSGAPEVVTHRVVAVGVDGTGERILTTRGDANNVADAEPVRAVQIRGVLVYSVPWLGWINIWATPAIKSVVVVAVGVLAIGWGVVALTTDAVRRRRAAAAAAAAALGAVLAAGLLPPPAAQAAEEPRRLLLSEDGVTWTDSGTVRLFDGTHALVPGDVLTVPIWVRNASDDAASLRMEFAWVPQDPTDAEDIAFAAHLRDAADSRAERALQAGESERLPIEVAFPATATNTSRDAAVALQVTATLTMDTKSPVEPALPATGSEIPTTALIGGLGLLVVGGGLLILRRIRRGRRD